jgi:hypothetical protein
MSSPLLRFKHLMSQTSPSLSGRVARDREQPRPSTTTLPRRLPEDLDLKGYLSTLAVETLVDIIYNAAETVDHANNLRHREQMEAIAELRQEIAQLEAHTAHLVNFATKGILRVSSSFFPSIVQRSTVGKRTICLVNV